jgi:hypothetical protein
MQHPRDADSDVGAPSTACLKRELCLLRALGTERHTASLMILRHFPLPWARQEWSNSVCVGGEGHVHRISFRIARVHAPKNVAQ